MDNGHQTELRCDAQQARELVDDVLDPHTGNGSCVWDFLSGSGVVTLSASLRGYRAVVLDRNPDMHTLIHHRLEHAATEIEDIVTQVTEARKRKKEELAQLKKDHPNMSPSKARIARSGKAKLCARERRHDRYKAWKKEQKTYKRTRSTFRLQQRKKAKKRSRSLFASKRQKKPAVAAPEQSQNEGAGQPQGKEGGDADAGTEETDHANADASQKDDSGEKAGREAEESEEGEGEVSCLVGRRCV